MNPLNFRLDGKCALITGAGRGIGLAIGRTLAAYGAAVALQDIDQDIAEKEAEAIRAAGGKAVAFGGDVRDLTLPSRLVPEAAKALGGLHILINNAALQSHAYWREADPQTFEVELRSNLTVPILMCQQAVAIFQPQRYGRIINLGSIQQLNGNPTMLSYSLSKSALHTMTRALARDLSKHGITVNLIAPGWIANTWRNRDDFPTPEAKEEYGKRIPLGRIGEPEDMAGVALLLCSEAGSYITGQSIFVDGGLSVGRA